MALPIVSFLNTMCPIYLWVPSHDHYPFDVSFPHCPLCLSESLSPSHCAISDCLQRSPPRPSPHQQPCTRGKFAYITPFCHSCILKTSYHDFHAVLVSASRQILHGSITLSLSLNLQLTPSHALCGPVCPSLTLRYSCYTISNLGTTHDNTAKPGTRQLSL